MKFFPLIWATLWRRKLRTLFTLFSVVVAFFLFGMLQGINLGIEDLYDVMSTERLRTRSRSTDGPMPLAHLQQIKSLPGVVDATPLNAVQGKAQGETRETVVIGVDVESWFKRLYSPNFILPEAYIAAMQRARNGVVVGKTTADDRGWEIGDRLPLESIDMPTQSGSITWEFEIVGIWDIPRRPQWATNILANFDYINEMRAEGADYSLQFITRIDNPDNYALVANAMDEQFTNSAYQTMTLSEESFIRTLLAQMGNVSYLLNGVVGAVLFTLLFLTANTMSLSVHERIPELAAMKTLGFTDLALLAMVLVEILMLCLVAGGIGLGSAAITFPVLMKTLGPTVGLEGMRIPLSVYILGAGITVLVALVSGLPPALRAMRLNIVDGLAKH